MSSASAGSVGDNSGDKNFANADIPDPSKTPPVDGMHAVSTTSAEAQQGDGPAAASASSAATGESTTHSSAVSVVVGNGFAAASGPFGTVAVGENSAAAACEIGVAAVSPDGAAASCNSANGSKVATAPGSPSPHRGGSATQGA